MEFDRIWLKVPYARNEDCKRLGGILTHFLTRCHSRAVYIYNNILNKMSDIW